MLGTSLNSPIIIFEFDNHPLWFLPASFLASMLFYIIKRKVTYWNAAATVCCCTVCIIVAKIASYLPILLPWSMDTVGCILVFLIIGDIIRQNGFVEKSPSMTKRQIIVMFIVALCYIILCKIDTVTNIAIRAYGKRGIIFYLLEGIMGSLLCIVFFWYMKSRKVVAIFQMLGKMSLSILCWHVWLYNIINDLVFHFSGYTLSLLKSDMQAVYYFYCVSEIFLVIGIIYISQWSACRLKECLTNVKKERI